MQFSFMTEIGTVDAVFILGRLQEEYLAKGKSCMCLVDIGKAFYRVKECVGISNEEERNTRSFC